MTTPGQFDWNHALRLLREEKYVRRLAWSETTSWLNVRAGRCLVNLSGSVRDWVPYLEDFDATDWVEVPENAT